MKAVIQRVNNASLYCDGALISEIKKGLVVYFGVAVGDEASNVDKMAEKIVNLRIFADVNGKSNLSVKDVSGEILAVSQFTLLADASHGNRPGFTFAEKPDRANELYELFLKALAVRGVPVKKGVFGGDMTIEQSNDGPYTIIYEL